MRHPRWDWLARLISWANDHLWWWWWWEVWPPYLTRFERLLVRLYHWRHPPEPYNPWLINGEPYETPLGYRYCNAKANVQAVYRLIRDMPADLAEAARAAAQRRIEWQLRLWRHDAAAWRASFRPWARRTLWRACRAPFAALFALARGLGAAAVAFGEWAQWRGDQAWELAVRGLCAGLGRIGRRLAMLESRLRYGWALRPPRPRPRGRRAPSPAWRLLRLLAGVLAEPLRPLLWLGREAGPAALEALWPPLALGAAILVGYALAPAGLPPICSGTRGAWAPTLAWAAVVAPLLGGRGLLLETARRGRVAAWLVGVRVALTALGAAALVGWLMAPPGGALGWILLALATCRLERTIVIANRRRRRAWARAEAGAAEFDAWVAELRARLWKSWSG